MDKEYTELDHRYLLEVDSKAAFNRARAGLPAMLQFLQDEGEIKGYALDSASSIGDNTQGFMRGRLAYRMDVSIDVTPLLWELFTNLEKEEDNTDDRK